MRLLLSLLLKLYDRDVCVLSWLGFYIPSRACYLHQNTVRLVSICVHSISVSWLTLGAKFHFSWRRDIVVS